MAVTTAAETSVPTRGSATGLQAQLAASLPGLSEPDLRGLAARVADELEERVGTELSRGLTHAQLDEFEQLMDVGDEERCTTWLQAARPNYQAVVMTVRARLVAEVVETVLTADPSAAVGRRDVANAKLMDIVVAHLESAGLTFEPMQNGRVRVGFTGSETVPEFIVDISQSGADMLCFVAIPPGMGFGAEMQPQLAAFVADWNAEMWLPKARVAPDEETGDSTLVAEIAVPLGAPATRAVVDALMRYCLAVVSDMFRTGVQRLIRPAG